MKKYLFIAGMIAAPLSVALAQTITFDTAIRWNTDVIKKALNDTGIISNTYSDVQYVHSRILNALVKMDTFSARDAVGVCMDECNKSEMLRYGQGKSGKKCPQLCEEFASSLVIANNGILTGNVEKQHIGTTVALKSGYVIGERERWADVITTFKDVEHSSKDFCRILTDDAFNRGVKYPMVCGGECQWLGQDIIKVYNPGGKYLYYEVDDYCDGFLSSGESYWVVHADGTIKKIKKDDAKTDFVNQQLDAIDKTYHK